MNSFAADGIGFAFSAGMALFRAAILLLICPLALRAGDSGARLLAEMNLARTQPQAYARIVAEQGGGSRAVEETVRFLERATPLPALEFSPGLARAASSHVLDQGGAGGFGHAGSDGGHSFDRIARYGQWSGAAGENIDYGSRSARATVVRLIVDDGIAGRKHRTNIFNRAFRVVGVAAGPHVRYGAMCVMDFAGGFVERAGNIAAR